MIKSIKGIDANTYKLKRRTDDFNEKKSHTCTKVSTYSRRVYGDDMVSLYERSNLFVPNVLLAYCHWYGLAWHGMMKHSMVWYSIAWHGMALLLPLLLTLLVSISQFTHCLYIYLRVLTTSPIINWNGKTSGDSWVSCIFRSMLWRSLVIGIAIVVVAFVVALLLLLHWCSCYGRVVLLLVLFIYIFSLLFLFFLFCHCNICRVLCVLLTPVRFICKSKWSPVQYTSQRYCQRNNNGKCEWRMRIEKISMERLGVWWKPYM